MQLPSVQARQLMGDHFPWIKQYFTESIPEGVHPNKNKTICIISEWINEPTAYANQSFKGWTIGVEVHIFYALNSSINSLDEEMKIAQLFIRDGWTVEQSKNHIKDLDTGQTDKVFYFAKDIRLRKKD